MDDTTSMSFSSALEEYLDLREKGPDESTGYTDKAYWARRQALLARLDELAPSQPEAERSPSPRG